MIDSQHTFVPEAGRSQRLLAAGGLAAALAASSCCILPVVLFSLGISGAWIGNLTQLARYQGYFIVATLGFVAAGYSLVYRSSRRRCDPEEACARPLSNRVVWGMLFAATILVAGAIAFDFLAPR